MTKRKATGTLPALEPPFGQRLREARLDKRLSVEAAAARSGVRPASWTQWEAGESSPSCDELLALIKALKPDVEWLVGLHQLPREPFSKRLRRARRACKLTVVLAALKTRLAATDWRQWEAGKGGPDIDQFTTICNLLKPDLHWFIGDFKSMKAH